MGTPVEYEYTGPANFFVDRYAGTKTVWQGKSQFPKFQEAGTEDDFRKLGVIAAIDGDFATAFEELYVDGPMPQFRRVESTDIVFEGTTADAVPGGTPYSGLTPAQIRALYTQKVGKRAPAKQTMASLIEEIRRADAAEAIDVQAGLATEEL